MKNFVVEKQEDRQKTENWPQWLLSARQAAEDVMLSSDWPASRDEEWKYTDTSFLERRTFSVPVADEPASVKPDGIASLASDTAVFVNGSFCPRLSCLPPGVEFLSSASGFESLPVSLRAKVLVPLANDHPALFALNLACFRNPAFLRLNRGVSAECHILHYYTGKAETAFFPRICVLAEERSSLVLSETFFAGDGGFFVANVADVFLQEGSALEYLRAFVHHPSAAQISSARIYQSRDSRADLFFYTNGGALVRDNLSVLLTEPGAQAAVNGLHALAGTAHADSHTCVEHIAPDAASTQLYKSILRDESHSVFNGKVIVRREAQKTSAYQLNRNLLLSSEARVDTKPQLEIMADDVRCTHGATIGQLDQDQLFYLLSRAIVREEALNMLISGFVDDVTGKLKNPRLRSILLNLISRQALS